MPAALRLAALFLVGFALAPEVAAQTARRSTDAPPSPGPYTTPGAPGQLPTERRGSLITYADRAAFDAAHPGLPVEDFEDLAVAPGSFCVSPSPAHASTNNGCVGAGALPEGLAVAAIGPGQGQPDALVAWDGGVFSNPTVVFGSNFFADDTELRFAPGVAAVAMDVYAFGEGTISVDVFDSNENPLGSVPVPAASGQFIGLASEAAPIGRIRLVLPDHLTLLDDVAFGGALPTPIEPGPATGSRVSAAPNPFRGSTTLTLAVPHRGHARLAVYDGLGREVAVLLDGAVDAGRREVVFDASALPAGAYLYRLVVGEEVLTGRLSVVQ